MKVCKIRADQVRYTLESSHYMMMHLTVWGVHMQDQMTQAL